MITQLNKHWRIIDDPLQWILQVRKGQPSARSSGWRGEHFCRQRTPLLRCIRENCGEVDPATVAIIESLPDWHPDRDKSFCSMAAE